jgi:hypothetical protein
MIAQYEYKNEAPFVVGMQLKDTLDSSGVELIAGIMIQSAYLKGKKVFSEEDLTMSNADIHNVLDYYIENLPKSTMRLFCGLMKANGNIVYCIDKAEVMGVIEKVGDKYIKPTQKMLDVLVNKDKISVVE